MWRILIALAWLCPPIAAMPLVFGPWPDLMPEEAPTNVLKFNGLQFAMADSLGRCSLKEGKLICALGPAFGPGAEMVFEKIATKGPSSLPLLRIQRKRLWQARYKVIHEYKEVPFNTGLGVHQGQSARVYYLDNIQWPVLLRAFDVVLNDKTCISISTKCGLEQGPLLEKEVAVVLASFKRTTQN